MGYEGGFTTLGNTGLQVSRLAFGCGFRGVRDQAAAERAIGYAMDSGINFIDCANTYRLRSGVHAEQALGEALRGKRHSFVITSKFGSILDEQQRRPNDCGSARGHMLRCAEESLRRLKTDYIDLYLLHLPDDSTCYEELLWGFDQLRREGKIRYAGLCNHSAWQIAAIQETGRRMGLCPISVVQNPYSLLNRSAEEELFPAAAYENVGVMAYSPLASGLLSGCFARGGAAPEKSTWHYDPCYAQYLQYVFPGRICQIVNAVQDVAEGYGVSSPVIAQAWALQNKSITSIVTGADTEAEFADALHAASLILQPEDVRRLNACSAGMRELFIHGVVQEKVERLKEACAPSE